MPDMHHYVVTASWEPEGCWECEGSTGQAFVFVRAHDGKEAVEVAEKWLLPEPYGQPRFLAATELALPVSPNARKPLTIAAREFYVRARSYVSLLKPTKERAS